MIQLTRLNNKPLTVNSDLIKFIEQSPDTLVTLITGEKIVVLEKADEVLIRIIDFRRSVLQGLPCPGIHLLRTHWSPGLPNPAAMSQRGKRG